MDLKNGVLSGDKRATARLISYAENGDPKALEIVRELFSKTGNAYVVGVTGPPGAGKSTLTDKMVKMLLDKGHRVGIIAIDPTSPFSGGAILGDRVRMQDLATHENVFIRSMGTRGHLGGLSKATKLAMRILDIYGMDYIFIETVGVGQSEIDIVKTADTTLMVMVPGLGDDIQAIKAGVMEIGDVFAVNKADRDGAARTAMEIEMMLDFNKDRPWRPPVKSVVAIKNDGVKELLDAIDSHRSFSFESGEYLRRKHKNTELEILELAQSYLLQRVLSKGGEGDRLKLLVEDVITKSKDVYEASEELIKTMEV